MSLEAESFAYGSNLYGGRPTFALTRRTGGEEVEVTLYELLPSDIADGRKQRFDRLQTRKSVNQVPLSDSLVGMVSEAVDDQLTLPEVESPLQSDLTEWSWSDWCAVEIATLRGRQLRAAQDLIQRTLEEAGVDAQIVLQADDGSVLISEGDGVRLALAFLGMKPLQRYDRLKAFADGIERMTLEECYYWHAKCRSPVSPNGTKALRVLLTAHIK